MSIPQLLHIQLFGVLRAERDGQPVAFPRRKAEALLAYLLLHPGPHPREQIAALFWGDGDGADARRALRVTLSDLRKALGEGALIGDRDTLALNPAAVAEADVWRFTELLCRPHAAATADLLAGLALYHGDLLETLYDEWVAPLRQQFRAAWLAALLLLVERYRAAGDYANAIAQARRLLQSEPAHETAHQHLIFCLAAGGAPEAALQQVEACRQALRQHLDADLSAETQALAASIRRRRSDVAGRLTNLPRPLTSFIGREAELEQIETLLAQTRLLTLTGPGGSGKTRLAIQTADEAAHNYPGGVWWVDLASLLEPELAAAVIARTLGVRERGDEGLLAQIAAQIGAQRLLLALDNCEHLQAVCAQTVEFLLGHCPGLTVLATSREPLDLPGEVVWETPALPTPPDSGDLRTLRQNESLRLFAERARLTNGGFELDGRNLAAVAAICRRLQGIPLAIELAAAQMDRLTPAEVQQRLQQTPDAAAPSAAAAVSSRQATLHAAMQWSFGLLTPVHQLLLRRLAIFDGGCDLTVASVVAGGYAEPQAPLTVAAGPNGLDPLPVTGEMVTRQALENLARKGLVQIQRLESGTRFGLLDTLADFLRAQCQGTDEWKRLAPAHACFYFERLQAGWPAMYSEREPAVLDQIEREMANLRRAWRWQIEADDWQAPPQAISLQARFWLVRGHYAESRLIIQALLAHPALPSLHPARPELLNSLGLTEWQSGQTTLAGRYFEAALAAFLALDLHQNAAMTSINLGGLYVDEEKFAPAQGYLEQGLAWARELGYERALAIGLNNLALLLTEQGQLARARDLLAECLALRHKLGDQRGLGISLNNLADVEMAAGRFDAARQLYAESLDLRARLGDRRGALIPALNMVRLLRQAGQWQAAAGLLGFADATLAQLGIRLAADAQREREESAAAALAGLGPAAFERAHAVGRGLTLQTVSAWLIEQQPSAPRRSPAAD